MCGILVSIRGQQVDISNSGFGTSSAVPEVQDATLSSVAKKGQGAQRCSNAPVGLVNFYEGLRARGPDSQKFVQVVMREGCVELAQQDMSESDDAQNPEDRTPTLAMCSSLLQLRGSRSCFMPHVSPCGSVLCYNGSSSCHSLTFWTRFRSSDANASFC